MRKKSHLSEFHESNGRFHYSTRGKLFVWVKIKQYVLKRLLAGEGSELFL